MILSRNILRRISSQINQNYKIVEVSPRDGLQNIKKFIPTEDKKKLIKKLVDFGLKDICPYYNEIFEELFKRKINQYYCKLDKKYLLRALKSTK